MGQAKLAKAELTAGLVLPCREKDDPDQEAGAARIAEVVGGSSILPLEAEHEWRPERGSNWCSRPSVVILSEAKNL